MLKLTFVNANADSVDLSNPYIITKVSGLHAKGVTIQQTPGFAQNGVYYYGSLDQARIINITAGFTANSINEIRQIESELSNVFNPRLGLGELRIDTGDGNLYKIAAAVAVQPDPYKIKDTIYFARQFDIVLFCPKPDILSYASSQIKLTGISGGLIYPKTYPITYGTAGPTGLITYSGDNPAQMLLDFRVESGGSAVVDPYIVNDNGEYIQLDTTIQPGERILINTNPDSPSIIHIDTSDNQTDLWDALIYGSTFFQLEVGDNTFSFTAASGNPELYITYNEHYSGIKYT